MQVLWFEIKRFCLPFFIALQQMVKHACCSFVSIQPGDIINDAPGYCLDNFKKIS